MASEPGGETADEAAGAVRRAAQDSAEELAKMGIDPRALGLEAADPDPPPPSSAPAGTGPAGNPGSGTAVSGGGRVSGRASPGGPAVPVRGVASLPGQTGAPTPPTPPTTGRAAPTTRSSAPARGAATPPTNPRSTAPPGAPASVPPSTAASASPPASVPPSAAAPATPSAPPLATPGAAAPPPGPTAPGRPSTRPSSPGPSSPGPTSLGPSSGVASPGSSPGSSRPTTYGRPRQPAPPPGGRGPAAAGVPPAADTTLSRPIGGRARPAAPTAEALRPLTKLVLPPSMGPSAGVRRLVRAVTLGVIEPRAAEAMEYERQLVARARLRRPEPRVIAVVAGKGGVGATTTAASVALILATLRSDTTAFVSARCGSGSLGERLAGRPAPPVPAVIGPEPQEPLWVYDSLAVVDGAPWHSPIDRAAMSQLLDRCRGQHPLTIVDVGNDLSDAGQAAIEKADQVVLVTSASQDAVAAVQVALSRVHDADPFRLGTAVLALTCLNPRQARHTVRRLRSDLGMQAPRTVPIGFDPWLAAGARIDPAQLRAATREAYLQIAALVVEPGSQEQWFAQPGAGSGAAPAGTAAGPPPGYHPAVPHPPAPGPAVPHPPAPGPPGAGLPGRHPGAPR